MKFGKTLTSARYEPWQEQYLDYSKLKHLLREGRSDYVQGEVWTDNDETRFVEELLNVQLEKVKSFQIEKYREIKSQTSECENQLEALHLAPVHSNTQLEGGSDGRATLHEILPKLDHVSSEINRLEKFSRINFTGFRKIIKKHDKRRGTAYKLRALLSSKLAELPLNTEDYSPLLYRLSAMYSFIRHHLHDEQVGQITALKTGTEDEEYDAVTYFVHPEDLVEVKTSILRHLPVLIYDPGPSTGVEAPYSDPMLTSLYFDNTSFSLYSQRLERRAGASSLRLRWFGQLNDHPDVTLELKTLASRGANYEQRIKMKRKHVASFLDGNFNLQKQVAKLKARGGEFENEALELDTKARNMQNFLAKYEAQPLLRTSYERVAFQVPGNDAIRISIDTHLKFSKPPHFTQLLGPQPTASSHPSRANSASDMALESDNDGNNALQFPWAVLTIKLRSDSEKKDRDWVHDLASSHLLREAPRFSKFVHGIAVLYEDSVTELPFWMSLMDTDIRRDPQLAFEDEQIREEQLLEEAQAVGSYGGTPRRKNSLHPYSAQSQQPEPLSQEFPRSSHHLSPVRAVQADDGIVSLPMLNRPIAAGETHGRWFSGFSTVLPSISYTKYARIRKGRQELPPGIEEPRSWLKDAGPVKVEPKVWLANQRTFIKWQHISVLLASLSLALYNSAGRYSPIAKTLAIVYTIIAVMIAVWGWLIYEARSRIIRKRSGEDLDNSIGPIIVCFSLGVALCVNLGLNVQG